MMFTRKKSITLLKHQKIILLQLLLMLMIQRKLALKKTKKKKIPLLNATSVCDTSKNRRSFIFFSDDDEKPEVVTTSKKGRTSKNRRSFIFFSDDDEKPEVDTTSKKGRKSRQNSNTDGLEKDKSSKKGKRISVNIGKILGFDENKSSSKPYNVWEDNFLEPDEPIYSPKSPKNSFYSGSPSSLKNKQISNSDNNNNNYNNNNNGDDLIKDYVESPQNVHRNNSITSDNDNNNSPNVIIDDSLNDDVQSTNSSTQPSSVDDQDYNQEIYNKPENEYNSGSPTTPKLIVTPIEPSLEFNVEITNKSDDQTRIQKDEQDKKEDKVDQNNAANSIIKSDPHEIKRTIQKSRNFEPLSISTNNIKPNVADDRERKNEETLSDQYGYDNLNEQVSKKLQELEEMNKTLSNTKEKLEAKVAEQNGQINKFNSMDQIMQQQIDLSKRMAETIQRLESKANVQKDEFDSTSVSKIFEETIKRLENKIDQQNEELIRLKSVVGQLSGENPQLLLANGNISRLRITQGEDQNLIISQQGEEERALIQTNHSQSPQIYSKSTLVSTLVVNPLYNTITVSASIATSVLYAVYVRPVVGLVSVFRDGISNCETAD
ncbi:hypothetical protein C1645_781610 [Glomus cerebriforme]|uniref:Uncharacterized protein n=1 Tax=Glomus cerebriforme TaxID=658196 RepID=A0A397SSE8_9GLOM|nr:hypothetical protein C1645_781610 [Glomus cerebriforme]